MSRGQLASFHSGLGVSAVPAGGQLLLLRASFRVWRLFAALAWLGTKFVLQEAPAPAGACVLCTAGTMLHATLQDVAAGLVAREAFCRRSAVPSRVVCLARGQCLLRPSVGSLLTVSSVHMSLTAPSHFPPRAPFQHFQCVFQGVGAPRLQLCWWLRVLYRAGAALFHKSVQHAAWGGCVWL